MTEFIFCYLTAYCTIFSFKFFQFIKKVFIPRNVIFDHPNYMTSYQYDEHIWSFSWIKSLNAANSLSSVLMIFPSIVLSTGPPFMNLFENYTIPTVTHWFSIFKIRNSLPDLILIMVDNI